MNILHEPSAIKGSFEDMQLAQVELASLERELANREQRLAARERELATREAEAHAEFRTRERQVADQEQRYAEREEQLSGQEKRLVQREEQLLGRERRLADREAELAQLWEQCAASRDGMESRSAELEQVARRLKQEEERLKEWRRQLDERGQRWDEACQEAVVLKICHPKPFLSPRLGKENRGLLRELGEQQDRMHEIKRRHASWGSDTDVAPREDVALGPNVPPLPFSQEG